jgi:hypothetical protein
MVRESVSGCRPETVVSSHEVLGEGHLAVEVEMESSALTFDARDPASPFASVSSSVGRVGAVVVVRHFVVDHVGL